ncbi:MAG: calcium-binding protein [Amylibacter sp.]
MFDTIAGQTLLSGGIIDSISVSQGGTDLGSLNDLNMPSATLSFAFLNEFFVVDPLALENLFLTEDWIFNGSNDAQVLTADMLTSDGVSYSPSGNDTAFLMGGDDIFDLGLGNDTVLGGSGHDQLLGGDGNDILNGDGAKDIMHGDGGDDIMFGGTGGGTDRMYGGEGNDLLNGGTGDDRMFGGEGENVFNGGTGDDRMYAGDDADTFVFNSITNTGDDDVYGYDTPEDTLDIDATAYLGISIFADSVIVNHSGGSITLHDVTITNLEKSQCVDQQHRRQLRRSLHRRLNTAPQDEKATQVGGPTRFFLF